ncbi:tyrosine-type recombinase/integrase [Ralstonia pseudosolanacearum]|uniref:tyrosine-type recombinase/integrase n=1 Tax=Ralstonia pseudosolanacearum TaxID=1310165 RepID=UPI002701ED9E|nr:tyrosine-type recombinase/integrase [Ralstonia pseudosolanacearum]MDO3615330.1 tyrosine-type recombinase/integrase [Ralstonia pseudosolanacearum]
MDTLWLNNPERAYADWQEREAEGVDGQHFSERSRAQHQAMFEKFLRYLRETGRDLANYGDEHVAAFCDSVGARSAATRMRYLKLLDRVGRQLVRADVRTSNPASEQLHKGHWPDEDQPLFLPEDKDALLQAYTQPAPDDGLREVRVRAVVALYLATGVTLSEGIAAELDDLQLDATLPYLHVKAKAARSARTVPITPFALPALRTWLDRRAVEGTQGQALLTLHSDGSRINEASVGRIVKAALTKIDFVAPDMSPRVLRNTVCRRLLLDGVDQVEVNRILGLSSVRTVDRIAATIER